jgi:DNA-binding GntR family transcriptional regulator
MDATMTIRSLAQQVYDFIVNEISTGSIQLGQKINEGELMQKLPISRTPIREALIQLASDGILENIPRKGFFVRSLNPLILLEYYRAVACLDVYAIKLAIPHMADRDFRKMEVIIDDIDVAIEKRDINAYKKLSDQFHDYYYRLSGSSSLSTIIFGIRDQCLISIYYTKDQERLARMLTQVNLEHRKILELAKRNDLEGLEELIFNHWAKTDPDWQPEFANDQN